MLKLLIKNEWNQYRNTWKSNGAKSFIVLIIMALISIGVLILLTKGASSLGHQVATTNISALLSILFLIVLSLIILIGIPQVFRELFGATDLQMLFTMPISTKHIFLVKYLKNFVGLPGIIWLILVIPLIVFGGAEGYPFLYDIVVFFGTLSIIVIATAITYLFNIGLIQILPASRAKELMTVMSAMVGIIIYILFQLPRFLIGSSATAQSLLTIGGLPTWLPTTMVSHSMKMAAKGSVGNALVPLLIVIILAAFFILLSTVLVDRGFRKGWIRLSESRRKKVTSKRGALRKLHHPVVFIGIKEWHSFRRDLREWMMFLPSLIIMIFPLANLFLSQGGSIKHLLDYSMMSWLIVQVLFLFFFGLLSGQLAASSVGREGKAAWNLRILPLSGRQIALGKFWISWLVPFVVLFIFEIVLGLILGWSWSLLVSGILVFAILSLGFTGMSLWIGTMAPRYNPNNPQDRIQPGTRYLLMLINLVYMVIAGLFGSMILFPVKYEKYVAGMAQHSQGFWHVVSTSFDWLMTLKTSHETGVVIIGVVGLVVFAVGVAAWTVELSAKRFDRGVQINLVQSSKGRRFRL